MPGRSRAGGAAAPSAATTGVYTCSAGCRGRHAVCDACNDKLARCVFCRSKLLRREADGASQDATPAVAAFAFFFLVFGWALLLASLVLLGGGGRVAGPDGRNERRPAEDAFGVPWDLDAPD